MISEAAKKVEVETHVLRYWEEELQLPIKRNEMGHRYYTMEDVKRFREIKQLKEQGLQLKAIRTIIKKGNISMENQEKFIVSLSHDETRDDKVIRLQYLLQHMMAEAVKSANQELCAEIKESIIKELDYQFRTREEKEEERFKREEEHFRKIDEMLRERNKVKEKPHKLFRKEKQNTKSYNMK